MDAATGGAWGSEQWAAKHAKENSLQFKAYAVNVVAPNPAAAAAYAAAVAAGGAGPAPMETADASQLEAVMAELLKLFNAAKGVSLSVLQASHAQERRGGNYSNSAAPRLRF